MEAKDLVIGRVYVDEEMSSTLVKYEGMVLRRDCIIDYAFSAVPGERTIGYLYRETALKLLKDEAPPLLQMKYGS